MSFDTDNLVSTLHLMKNRNCDFIKSPENFAIIEETNKLLKNGLILNLIQSIEKDVNEYARGSNTTSSGGFSSQAQAQEVNLQNLRTKGEILFFTFYQTQITEDEEKALIGLIRFLSNLVAVPVGGQSTAGGPESVTPSWQIPVCSLLVIIQLAHVCALQQTTYLLLRDKDYSKVSSLEELEVGNDLASNKAGYKYRINESENKSDPNAFSFKCEGVKGFACLAYAVLRQPEVDIERAPASDVEYFLYHACISRAYSYVRLVMMPILQTAYVQDRETSLFYFQVLTELLENLSNIYCMSHYRQQYTHNDNDFPYVFFPPSQSFYAANVAYYNESEHQNSAAENGGKSKTVSAVDTLEDVLMLFNVVLEARPEFALAFWPNLDAASAAETHNQSVFGASGGSFNTTFEQSRTIESTAHPFVLKAVEATHHHHSVMLPTMHFLSNLASAPLGSTAFVAYNFVKGSRHPLFSWSHFFQVIDQIAVHLGANLAASTSSQTYNTYHSRGTTGALGNTATMTHTYAETLQAQAQHQHAKGQRPYHMTDKDAEGLVAIMHLLSAAATSSHVASLLLEQYPVVSRMFCLLSCPLPVNLKGSVLDCLAVFARLSPGIAAEIWGYIDEFRLLPSAAGQFGATGSSNATVNMSNIYNNLVSPTVSGANPMHFTGPTVNFRDTLGSNASGALPHSNPHGSVGSAHAAPRDTYSAVHHTHEKGLRAELEEHESRSGQYPITEGFLSLLSALCVHNIPNSSPRVETGSVASSLQDDAPVGTGIMLYLEYILNDVLLKAHDRTYSPADSPLAYGVRFRITSRVVGIMVKVLQHYQINVLPDDILVGVANGSVTVQDAKLREIIQDFTEEVIPTAGRHDRHIFNSSAGSSVSSTIAIRNKTAGFYVMTQLLNKTRLFTLLLNVLQECNAAAIAHQYNLQCMYVIGASLGVLHKQYNHSQNSVTYNLATHTMIPIEPLNLTELSAQDKYSCDGIYWREHAVSSILGLLYECSLRERKLNTLFHSTTKQLTIMHTDYGRSAVLPVTLEDFSTMMISSSAVSLIAHYISYRNMTVTSVPNIAMMCMRLLEHIALYIPNYQLLATLSQPVQLPVTASSAAATPSTTESVCSSMIKSIVAALTADNSNVAATLPNTSNRSLHYDVVYRGGDIHPVTLSLTLEDTLVTPVNLFHAPVEVSAPGSEGGASHVQTNTTFNKGGSAVVATKNLEATHRGVIRAILKYSSTRDAVIRLLLTTLAPDTVCLSHYLLGVTAAQQQYRNATMFSATLPADKKPITTAAGTPGSTAATATAENTYCLEALLECMSPDSYPTGTTFLQLHPQQAQDCYELLYRLVSSPVCSATVIAKLTARSVDFVRVHATVLLYLAHLEDAELLESFNNEDATAQTEQREAQLQVDRIRNAVHSSIAWVLKTCSVMLFSCSVSSNGGAVSSANKKIVSSITKLFYSSCKKLSFAEERSVSAAALTKLLQYCSSFPKQQLPVLNSRNGVVHQCIAAATTANASLNLSKGGSGYCANNKFRTVYDASTVVTLEQTIALIDVSLLRKHLTERIVQPAAPVRGLNRVSALSAGVTPTEAEEALQYAVLYNVYHKRIAAMIHSVMAVAQLINITCANNNSNNSSTATTLQSILVDNSVTSADAYVLYVYEEVALPLVRTLRAAPLLDILVYETLARSLLSVVTHIYRHNSVHCDKPHTSVLTADRHNYLLTNLMELLLSRSSSSDAVSPYVSSSTTRGSRGTAVSSVLYRGLLSTCITVVLQATASSSVAAGLTSAITAGAAAGDTETPSEEDKSSRFEGSRRGGSAQQQQEDLAIAYQTLSVETLKQFATELTDSLAADILASPLVWRCAATTTLGTVLSLLSPAAPRAEQEYLNSADYRHVYGSHSFVQSIQLLVQKRHLAAILTCIGTVSPGGVEYSSGGSRDETLVHNEVLFANTLTLCTHIATVAEGVEALLQSGFLQRLNSLTYFLTPPPLPNDLLAFGAEAMRAREEAVVVLQNRLLPVLRVLNTMLSTASDHHGVRKGVADFLVLNHTIVSQLLKLRYLTLTGLQMTEQVASLFAMLIQAPGTKNTGNLLQDSLLMITDGNSNPNKVAALPAAGVFATSTVAALLGNKADIFIADICSLMNVMGSDAVPSALLTAYSHAAAHSHYNVRPTHSVSDAATWWDHVKPERTRANEVAMVNTLYAAAPAGSVAAQSSGGFGFGNSSSGNVGVVDDSLPLDWTQFDHAKMTLSLNITTHLVTFLRILTTGVVTTGRGTKANTASGHHHSAVMYTELLNVDLDTLAHIFTKCASQVILFQSSSAPSRPDAAAAAAAAAKQQSKDWLTSPQPVIPTGRVRFAGLDTADRANTTESTAAGDYLIRSTFRGAAGSAGKVGSLGGLDSSSSASASSDNQYVESHVLPKLIFVIENTICTVHDLLLLLSRDGSTTSTTASNALYRHVTAIDGILKVCELFPSHSFVRQVARWVKDLMDQQMRSHDNVLGGATGTGRDRAGLDNYALTVPAGGADRGLFGGNNSFF